MPDSLCLDHRKELDALKKEMHVVSVNLFGGLNEDGDRVTGFCNEMKTSLQWVTRIQKWMVGIFTSIIVFLFVTAIKYAPTVLQAAEIVKDN